MGAVGQGVDFEVHGLGGSSIGVDAIVAIEELLLLDDLWTAALQDLKVKEPADAQRRADDFRRLISRIDGALYELPPKLQRLEAVLNGVEDADVDKALASIAGAGWIDPSDLDDVSGDVLGVGPRGAAILACQFLAEEVGAERDVLAGKADLLASGEIPDPDLRPIFRCALYLAGVGASAAAVVGTHGLAFALHLGTRHDPD